MVSAADGDGAFVHGGGLCFEFAGDGEDFLSREQVWVDYAVALADGVVDFYEGGRVVSEL